MALLPRQLQYIRVHHQHQPNLRIALKCNTNYFATHKLFTLASYVPRANRSQTQEEMAENMVQSDCCGSLFLTFFKFKKFVEALCGTHYNNNRQTKRLI